MFKNLPFIHQSYPISRVTRNAHSFFSLSLIPSLTCFMQVCGMCGNYNGNASDDNLMPNGQPAKDVIELGDSWKSEGDSDPG